MNFDHEMVIVGRNLLKLVESDPTSKSELDGWYLIAADLYKVLQTLVAQGVDVPEIIFHYLSDADIRVKDSVYGSAQLLQVRNLADQYLSGRNGIENSGLEEP